MKLSIAMATYNGAEYLKDQLSTFVSQNRRPDEIIVCDDGSTDATLKILEDFSENAPFDVFVFKNEKNLGFAKNFEKAISLCSGDIIFLSDQDDVWFPEKLEYVEMVFSASPVMVVVNDAELTDANLKPTGLTIAAQVRSAGLTTAHLPIGCCTAFRSELKQLVIPIPAAFRAHDIWITTLGDTLGTRSFLPRVLQYYRRHGKNTSGHFTARLRPASPWLALADQLRFLSIRRRPEEASAIRIFQIAVLRDRLVEHRSHLTMVFTNTKLDEVFRCIDLKYDNNKSRLALQQTRFWSRIKLGLAFFLKGGYRSHQGARSFIRDIFGTF